MDPYEAKYVKLIEYVRELIDILIDTHAKADKCGYKGDDKKKYFQNVWKQTDCKYHVNKMIKDNKFLQDFKIYAVSVGDNIQKRVIEHDQKLICNIVTILNVMHTSKLSMTQLMDFIHDRVKVNELNNPANLMSQLDNIKVPTGTPSKEQKKKQTTGLINNY